MCAPRSVVRIANGGSFFFQAEDGIRVRNVTGVQTCALPISRFNKLTTALAARLTSATFSGLLAGWLADPGKLIPKHSMAEAIVLAVYIPPQPPGPGQALTSISCTSSLLISP